MRSAFNAVLGFLDFVVNEGVSMKPLSEIRRTKLPELADEHPGEVYAVTAYLLYLNGIVDRDWVIDSERLPAIIMPNRQGFIELHH